VAHINDAHVGGALSTVAAGKFGAGRTTAVAATHAQLSGARMMTGNMPVVPTRASLSASGRAAAPSTIHSTAAQHFYGTQSTSHTESFQQQTAHLQQAMQQAHFSPVAAGARVTGLSSASAGSTTGKAAASTASSKETNSSAAKSAATQAPASENENRSGASNAAASPASDAKGAESASAHSESNSEWKSFTPESHSNESHSNESAARGANGTESASRSESGSYWNRTASSSNYSRESGATSRSGYSRPQLNMRQPIAQPRGSAGYGGSHGSGGSHSAPSSGGSHASGSGGGHSGGGGGGGHH